MRVFVTGVNGQLGHDVSQALALRGHFVIRSARKGEKRPDFAPLDICDAAAVQETLLEYRPDAVIHCASWTAVDAAEENREACMQANVTATQSIVNACKCLDCKLLFLSTDYVFSGEGERPWDADSTTFAPCNVYGASKRMAEEAVEVLKKSYIVRISWVFGKNGSNFVTTMLQLAEKHETLRVVCDQVGAPTYTKDLAKLLADMIETQRYGYYHATNEGGYISWYDFACEIFRQAGLDTRVIPVTTEEYGSSRARRPKNSRLDTSKLAAKGFTPLPHWQDALQRYLKEIGRNGSDSN